MEYYVILDLYTLENPGIGFGGHRSRHLVGRNLISFLVSHLYFFAGGGTKSIAKLDGRP